MKTTKYLMVLFATLIFFISGCTNQTPQTTTIAAETTTTLEMPATTTTGQAITSTTATQVTTTTTPANTGKTLELTLTAKNIAFDQKTITVPAGAHIKLLFKNQDANVPHNFALYDSSEAKTNYFKGQIIKGVSEITYEFDAPATPGTYFFRCDPHAQIMNGDFVVQPAASTTTLSSTTIPTTAQTTTTTPIGGKTVNIEISGFAFNPRSIKINKGDTVVWTNMDSVPHTVTSDSGNELDSKTLSRGDTYSHTFGTAGTFSYHCNIHLSMTGTITVE